VKATSNDSSTSTSSNAYNINNPLLFLTQEVIALDDR
jgi:hypothetical protein